MSDKDTIKLGFLLVDGFALMSYASVMEPFRAANVLAGRPLYAWRHIALAGGAAKASNGIALGPGHQVGDALDLDILFVCAGGNPAAFRDQGVYAWLRRLAARGVTLAGVSAGPYILARAGLLDGSRCTIHWEHLPAFMETFPTLRVEGGLYVMDGKRLTCAGGIAGLDMALDLIARQQGADLAARVSDWYIRTESRRGTGAQRMSLAERYGVRHEKLLKVLAYMEANLEEPGSRPRLAALAGVSVRQLDRLFAAHLKTTVTDHYLRLRLEQAARLLGQTALSITEVAVACGFKSASHFSRQFKTRFGRPPRQYGKG